MRDELRHACATAGEIDAERAQVLALAQLCHLCRVAYLETAARFRWLPEPGSGAGIMAALLPTPDPRVPSADADSGHRLVGDVVSTYLVTAAGHLGGLSALYARGEVLFSPGPLVRCVIECCSRAMWVLGDGAGPASDLLARAYLEELLSASHAVQTARGLAGPRISGLDEHERALARMRAQAHARFPDGTRKQLDRGELGGQTRASLRGAVKWMFALLEVRAGSTLTAKQSLGVYDFLSNVTHPTLYATRELQRQLPSEADATQMVNVMQVDAGSLRRQTAVAVAVAAFYNALSYLTSFFGWDTAIHEQLTGDVDRLLPGLLRDPR